MAHVKNKERFTSVVTQSVTQNIAAMLRKELRGFAKSMAVLALMFGASVQVHAAPAVSSSPMYEFDSQGKAGWATSAVSLIQSYSSGTTCYQIASKNMAVDIPAGAVVKKAFLYWSASQKYNENISFGGQSIGYDQRWTASIGTLSYVGYRKDVTDLVTGSGSYAVTNLTSSATVTSGGGCVAGAQLITIYELPTVGNANALSKVRIYDGYHGIRGSAGGESTYSTVSVPLDGTGLERAVVTNMTWQGNSLSEHSQYADYFYVNGQNMGGTDINNGSGANINNTTAFSTVGRTALSQYTVDTDTLNITAQAQNRSTLTLQTGSVSWDYIIEQGYVVGIRETPTTATLTLQKTVVNNNGGTATAADFTLTATGPTTITGKTGEASITAKSMDEGHYALTESGPADYNLSLGCTGAADTDLSDGLDLVAGENVVCTYTNSDIVTTTSLSVTKTASPTKVNPGDPLTYTITVTDQADGIPATDVVASDTLDAAFTSATVTCSDSAVVNSTVPDVSCTWANIADGETRTMTVQVTAP